jgi:hypothetical protein
VAAEIPIGTNVHEPAVLWSIPGALTPAALERDHNRPPATLKTFPGIAFAPQTTCRLKMAFVDRRVTVQWGESQMTLELPPVKNRIPVIRPLTIGVKEGRLTVKGLRLFRDVFYTQDGHNGVGGQPVRLGANQYFVLGDNSSASQDSRFWPHNGAIGADSLIGRPLRFPW